MKTNGTNRGIIAEARQIDQELRAKVEYHYDQYMQGLALLCEGINHGKPPEERGGFVVITLRVDDPEGRTQGLPSVGGTKKAIAALKGEIARLEGKWKSPGRA